jgi:hypothetical protein
MNREHPNCTERPSLNKECGWKGGDRSGLAQGQELTGRKRRTKTSLQERKKRKTYLTLTGLLMEGVGVALQLMALESEAISGCAGAEGRPSEVLSMKIALQYCEQASRVYYGAVFRSQKGNSGLRSNRHGPVCPEEFLRKGETIYTGGDP